MCYINCGECHGYKWCVRTVSEQSCAWTLHRRGTQNPDWLSVRIMHKPSQTDVPWSAEESNPNLEQKPDPHQDRRTLNRKKVTEGAFVLYTYVPGFHEQVAEACKKKHPDVYRDLLVNGSKPEGFGPPMQELSRIRAEKTDSR